MRVLVTSNMKPSASAPQRGSFVRDQVAALRALGVEVELLELAPRTRNVPRAVLAIRRALRKGSYDLVHAHYGITGAAALLAGARPLIVTFHGTDVRHPVTGRVSRPLTGRVELVAAASRALFFCEGGRPALPRVRERTAVLPCGADTRRFAPIERAEARRRLGLEPGGRYLLFPADPARAVKRHDRAAEVAGAAGAELLTAGSVEPERMPELVNAASAVLITSDNEGFGLAAVEAMACETPVISTDVGAVPALARGAERCHVGPYSAERFAAAARAALEEPRPATLRAAADWLSARRTAERVLAAYEAVLERNADQG